MRALLASGGATALPAIPAPSPVASMRTAKVALEREEARVRVYRTAASVPILVMRRFGTPLVQIGVHIAGGAAEESASLAGLTSLLTRTSVKGTRTRSAAQIAEDGELLGGSVSGSTGAESFGWGISVPARHADAALELLSDVVQHADIRRAGAGDRALARDRRSRDAARRHVPVSAAAAHRRGVRGPSLRRSGIGNGGITRGRGGDRRARVASHAGC